MNGCGEEDETWTYFTRIIMIIIIKVKKKLEKEKYGKVLIK